MSDCVNKFFRKHYPSDYATNWKMQPISDDYGREYRTRDGSYIFPLLVCADGFSMSVQGHFGAYSYPRDDFAERYESVEVWELSDREPLFDDYGDGSSPLGYVPVRIVVAVIEKHGGIKP